MEAQMPVDDNEEGTVIPFPGAENEAERQRIRSSNERDQELERQGKESRHNRGYDEAADGAEADVRIDRIVEED